MAETKIICCGGELAEERDIFEKWICPRCGRVYVVIARRPIRNERGERSG